MTKTRIDSIRDLHNAKIIINPGHIDVLFEEIDRLHDLLLRYGSHATHCAIRMPWKTESAPPCDCGFAYIQLSDEPSEELAPYPGGNMTASEILERRGEPAVTVPTIPTGGTLAETEPVARKILEDAGLRLAEKSGEGR